MPSVDYDLKKAILPARLGNTDEHFTRGNPNFNTTDEVFLYSFDDVRNLDEKDRLVYVTDYAVMCGAVLSCYSGGYKNKKTAKTWCRSAAHSETYAISINSTGNLDYDNVARTAFTIRPVMRLKLEYFLAMRDNMKLNENVRDGYHTVTLGLEFPGSFVGAQLNATLNSLKYKGQLKKTGARYTGFMRNEGGFVENEEYKYNGKRYVCTQVHPYNNDSEFEDRSKCPAVGPLWAKVEPVVFRIRNWDDLPKSINPKGNGNASYVEVETEEGIISGLPFHTDYGSTEMSMWQNSLLRAYLNGYDLHKEIDNGNGNRGFKTDMNFNFEGRGFLNEAMQGIQMRLAVSPQAGKRTPNPYGFTYEELDNDELLKMYVKSSAAIFLHGPSGVGKSQRVKQLDPTATRITLRPQMNPEEVDGTLDRETGKYIPPLWYTQLCEKCKAEPDRKHVLFIDELTNVKPTVQSLIYSIVLDRAGKDGLWPLPDNAVVVAVGNESADNLAEYPLTNALFRRFSHIYYQVEKESWLNWATGVSKIQKQEHIKTDNTPRAKIHPAIVAYIMSRNEDVLNQDLDEENPKIVTDPRKWEIASNVLYATKNPRALKPAIGEELTEDFVDFVLNIHLSVEDVLKGNYNENEFKEMDISRKLSTLVGLCMASEKELPVVRSFIANNMGKEILATYDLLWIRNDPERAQIIAESKLSRNEEDEDGLDY